jgi:hypothetical protein
LKPWLSSSRTEAVFPWKGSAYALQLHEHAERTGADAAPPVRPPEPVPDVPALVVRRPGHDVPGGPPVHGDGPHEAVRVAEDAGAPVPEEGVPRPGSESRPPDGFRIVLVGEEDVQVVVRDATQAHFTMLVTRAGQGLALVVGHGFGHVRECDSRH